MTINPNFFVTLVHVSSIRIDGLALVGQTMTQTHNELTLLLFLSLAKVPIFKYCN